MATSSFAVIEKYQGLLTPPVRAGGELKVIDAALAVREINPNATMIFYFAVDYARVWYDLGRWFDQHPYLEVHDADGQRTNHTDSDGGAPNVWGIFDWSQQEARSAWVDRIASVVTTADSNGNNVFDGVFIDGYRGNDSWTAGLMPKATPEEQAAWLAGAKQLGPALADALGNETIRFINPGQVFSEYPGCEFLRERGGGSGGAPFRPPPCFCFFRAPFSRIPPLQTAAIALNFSGQTTRTSSSCSPSSGTSPR